MSFPVTSAMFPPLEQTFPPKMDILRRSQLELESMQSNLQKSMQEMQTFRNSTASPSPAGIFTSNTLIQPQISIPMSSPSLSSLSRETGPQEYPMMKKVKSQTSIASNNSGRVRAASDGWYLTKQPEDLAKERRKMINRESAKRIREKKKQHEQEMLQRMESLQKENEELRRVIEGLINAPFASLLENATLKDSSGSVVQGSVLQGSTDVDHSMVDSLLDFSSDDSPAS